MGFISFFLGVVIHGTADSKVQAQHLPLILPHLLFTAVSGVPPASLLQAAIKLSGVHLKDLLERLTRRVSPN